MFLSSSVSLIRRDPDPARGAEARRETVEGKAKGAAALSSANPPYAHFATRAGEESGCFAPTADVRRTIPDLKAGIDRLAFQRQDGEHAFMDPA